jgi:N-methylhydantoinase B
MFFPSKFRIFRSIYHRGQTMLREPNETFDPVTLELMSGALSMALREMESLLERTAMSPFIREKKDFHVALSDAQGRVIAGSGGMTGEFMSVIFDRYRADQMSPGDIYWYNDCYGSRGIVSHSPDQVFVAPVYHQDLLIGFSQSWAHFNDIGGMHPGTISPDATSIYQEGIIVPVVRLQHRGQRNDDLQYLFEQNSRYPQMVRGDIRASIAAARLGERRLIEIFDRFGADVARAGLQAGFERTATLLKSKLHELFADGTYEATEVIATDGKGNGPFHIRVKLSVEEEKVRFDATETDDQAAGPINYLMHAGTPASTLGRYLLSRVPEARSNHGMRGITAVRFSNCVMGLVNQATGGAGGAGNSAYVIYNMRGMHNDKPFLLSDGVAIGYGARTFADGIDAVYLVGQKNYPAEFMEMVYPVRVRAYGLLTDSGGPGRWRGGCAVFREVELLANQATLSVRIDGVGNPPWGVAGGKPGRGGRAIINPGTPDEREIDALSDGTILKRGDVFRIETVGGGGWGDPLDRDPELVRADALGRFIGVDSVLLDYGVVLAGPDLDIDFEATKKIRLERKSSSKISFDKAHAA